MGSKNYFVSRSGRPRMVNLVMEQIGKLEEKNKELQAEMRNNEQKYFEIIKQQQAMINLLEKRIHVLETQITFQTEKQVEPEPVKPKPEKRKIVTEKLADLLIRWIRWFLNYIGIPFVMVIFMILEPLKSVISILMKLFFLK